MPFASIQSHFRVQNTCTRSVLVPFPYNTYFIDVDGLPTNADSYYNDATLDAVQLNVNLGGDPLAWAGSPLHDVIYKSGLLTTSSVSGIDVSGAAVFPAVAELDNWRYSGYFRVDSPLADNYIDTDQTNPGGQLTGIRRFPGVASADVWGNSPNVDPSYIQVPCYGRPIFYEHWFSDNPTKTNENITFSGYTTYGDMNGFEFPTVRYDTGFSRQHTEGYVRRYVAGIVKVGADLSTLDTTDIMFGALFIGTPVGGTSYLCINGVVIKTASIGFRPNEVYAMCDTSWGSQAYASLLDATQGYDDFEIGVQNNDIVGPIGSPTILNVAYGVDDFIPVDTYDVKWGWYYDYVPDDGEGTFCGLITARSPDAYTHPGWPCSFNAGNQLFRITNWLYNDIDVDFENVNFGYTEISDDGLYLISGGDSVVRIFARDTGAATPWTFVQTLEPSSRTVSTYGAMDVCISGDGTRAAFGGIDTDGTNMMWVFVRTGDLWTEEQRLVSTNNPLFISSIPGSSVDFNTTSNVNGATDTITPTYSALWDIANRPLQAVRYSKNGGTANIGLVDNQIYWLYIFPNGSTSVFSSPPSIPNSGAQWIDGIYNAGELVYYSGSWYVCMYETDLSPASYGAWELAPQLVALTAGGNETHEFHPASPSYINDHTLRSGESSSIRLSYSGNTLVTNKYSPIGSLAAIVTFTRIGSIWTEQPITPIRSSAATDDYDTNTWTDCGSISLSNDGTTVACGKRGQNTGSPSLPTFEVDIFNQSNGMWILESTIAQP